MTSLRERAPERGTVRMLGLQTPLAIPQRDEVDRLHGQFAGFGMRIECHDPGLWERADATRPDVLEAIDQADLILVTGGDLERMARVLTDTPALDALREVSRRGAVIGGSAGAMVFGAGFPAQRGDEPYAAPLLGWLPDIAIAPHFGVYPIAPWIAAWSGKSILALPDGAVALVTDSGTTFTSLGAVPAQVIVPVHSISSMA
jgi:hypothetical protein